MVTQHGLLYLPVDTHGLAVPAMLDTGATWSFVNHKLAVKLPATIQTTTHLIVMFPTRKMLVATLAI